MKPATIVGILLLILGIVGFAVGGFSFSEHQTDANVGPVQIGHNETHHVPISPILSTIALVGGIGLVVVGSRSR